MASPAEAKRCVWTKGEKMTGRSSEWFYCGSRKLLGLVTSYNGWPCRKGRDFSSPAQLRCVPQEPLNTAGRSPRQHLQQVHTQLSIADYCYLCDGSAYCQRPRLIRMQSFYRRMAIASNDPSQEKILLYAATISRSSRVALRINPHQWPTGVSSYLYMPDLTDSHCKRYNSRDCTVWPT